MLKLVSCYLLKKKKKQTNKEKRKEIEKEKKVFSSPKENKIKTHVTAFKPEIGNGASKSFGAKFNNRDCMIREF